MNTKSVDSRFSRKRIKRALRKFRKFKGGNNTKRIQRALDDVMIALGKEPHVTKYYLAT